MHWNVYALKMSKILEVLCDGGYTRTVVSYKSDCNILLYNRIVNSHCIPYHYLLSIATVFWCFFVLMSV